ncbi:Uncharacterized protein FVE85_3848 [Porphyridium purpureum]|uniref:Uncharacterized protein n=1 Tax=Porphyridium purpureum TaxID=35688 RepID=A0A5J4YJ05_PORPP|nr:Uncharacterized protein FVE85_9416 [Porphyridium purpureum]KAA8490699.1 Uncharacterized protein FVE85_3848 [Porphyridium purpureum]|eukprot:POR7563..scf243_20
MGSDARGLAADLPRLLQCNDSSAYGAYEQLVSRWYTFAASGAPRFELSIAHVQSDAYAAPSRVGVSCLAGELAVPVELLALRVRCVACCDILARRCCIIMHQFEERAQGFSSSGDAASTFGSDRPVSKSGQPADGAPGRVYSRAARFELGLPASGRTIEGRKAHMILCETVPRIVQQSFLWLCLEKENDHQTGRQHSAQAAHEHVICTKDQAALRGMLEPAGLVAFVLHGANELPMPSASALPFSSPDALRVSTVLPSGKTLTGMGIRNGVNLIVGGGFHGKSTLLQAIELGVYDRVPGDGREFVSCLAFASKMRAEGGRAVTSLDMSPFISNLPFGPLAMGCNLLIFDENTGATNFMYRDEVMSALVGKHNKPIAPFLERVRMLYKSHGISSPLLVDSCGAFFDVADTVILIESASKHMAGTLQIQDTGRIYCGLEEFAMKLRALEQLVELGQTRVTADAVRFVEMASEQTAPMQGLKELVARVEAALGAKGIDVLAPSGWKGIGFYSRPRSTAGGF